jgi:hypothetical protein
MQEPFSKERRAADLAASAATKLRKEGRHLPKGVRSNSLVYFMACMSQDLLSCPTFLAKHAYHSMCRHAYTSHRSDTRLQCILLRLGTAS